MLWKPLFQKPISSLLTLVAITAALTLLGVYWTLLENIERVRIEKMSQSGEPGTLSLFVEASSTAQEIENLKSQILATQVFQKVESIPAEKSIEVLQEQFGQALSTLFEKDSLPITFKLTLKDSAISREVMINTVNSLRAMPKVLDVDEGLKGLPGVSANSSSVSPVFSWATAFFVLVFIVISLLVSHLVRLVFESVRNDVDTLKILGAPRFWILRPFVVESFLFGLAGSLFALFLIAVLVHRVAPQVAPVLFPQGFELQALSMSSTLKIFAAGIIACLLGSLATWPLVNRPPREA